MDTGVATVQQLRELNCNNASVYGTTTTYGTATATASDAAATSTASDSDETAVQSGFASATESGDESSATGSSDENSAAGLCIGVAAVAAAGLGLLL